MSERTDAETVLGCEGLAGGYVAEVDIIRGATIGCRRGEIVSIVGANGAGKSTMLKMLMGIVPPREGVVRFDGADVTRLAPHKLARMGVGYVPQLDNVFASLTIQENLLMGAIGRRGLDVGARMDAVYELFPRLAERRRQAAGTMSGGERQLVAIGRALIGDPQILVLDEPSAGLSPVAVDIVFEQIVAINRAGTAILMVEQNARRALAMSDWGYVLDLGTNRYEGRGADLVGDRKIAELYLGGMAGSSALGGG